MARPHEEGPGAIRRAAAIPSALSILCLAAGGAAQCTLQWSAFGTLPATASDLLVTTAGDVFASSPNTAPNVWRWDGAAWQPLAGLPSGSFVHDLLPDGGGLLAAGSFSWPFVSTCLARWDGSRWSPEGIRASSPALTMVRLANGDILVGGVFIIVGGVMLNRIGRWNGTHWAALGSGVDSSGGVRAVLTRSNGDVIVGGSFSIAGGISSPGVARWDGTRWHSMGLGVPPARTIVYSLAELPNGDIVAGGLFPTANPAAPNVALWNGTTWLPMGSGLNAFVKELQMAPDGNLLAAGPFTASGTTPAAYLARWNGSAWAEVPGFTAPVEGLALQPDDSLLVVGPFAQVGTVPVTNVARAQSSCLASVATLGASCVGSNGPVTLTHRKLPWVGATFSATGAGLPAQGLVASLFGFGTTSIPIATIVPQGLRGCTALVTADAVTFPPIAAGTATSQLALPAAPWLVGQVLHHQMLPIEVASGGGLLAVAASNGLSLTIGSW